MSGDVKRNGKIELGKFYGVRVWLDTSTGVFVAKEESEQRFKLEAPSLEMLKARIQKRLEDHQREKARKRLLRGIKAILVDSGGHCTRVVLGTINARTGRLSYYKGEAMLTASKGERDAGAESIALRGIRLLPDTPENQTVAERVIECLRALGEAKRELDRLVGIGGLYTYRPDATWAEKTEERILKALTGKDLGGEGE